MRIRTGYPDWMIAIGSRLKPSDKTIAIILTAARFLIGGLFFYSGLSKLIQPIEYFEVAVGFYEIVPDSIIHYVSYVLPWIELVCGTYLLLGFSLNFSGAALAGLTGLFQLVLAQALLRRLPIDECGCFGGGFIHLSLYQSFMLDTILVLTLIQIASSEKSLFSLDNWIDKKLPG